MRISDGTVIESTSTTDQDLVFTLVLLGLRPCLAIAHLNGKEICQEDTGIESMSIRSRSAQPLYSGRPGPAFFVGHVPGVNLGRRMQNVSWALLGK